MQLEYVEKLSLHEQFRLVEIAHESSDHEIKKAALAVLGKYLNPLVRVISSSGLAANGGHGWYETDPV